MEKEWIARLAKKSCAVSLVRDLLGCGCPEEVFEHYHIQPYTSGSIPMVQLIMGDRLLVRIVDAAKSGAAEETVMNLLEEGLKERERRKLNRFRLVMVGTFSPSKTRGLEDLTEAMDPKVHLHVLPRLELD